MIKIFMFVFFWPFLEKFHGVETFTANYDELRFGSLGNVTT